MKRPGVILCALVLLAVTAIYFAQPLLDGDLFWHMAYARQMLERHTLVPDHTAFSWTPASNRMIYCAWASELFFFWLWQHLGIAAMFAFRYLCVAAVLGLAWNYARQLGLERAPLSWLVLMMLLIGSSGATIVKPEIFSLVFFNILVWLYFQFRLDGRARWLYLAPVLMLVWVNTHGGFILAAPFLVATAIGEALERRLSRHLAIAWFLCGAAVLATPYGWVYPWQLLSDYVLSGPRPDVAWNDAHLSIFAPGAAGLHYIELLALMAAILLLLAVQRRRLDWNIVLANLVYVPLFMIYLRTTFLWPVVFCYSALHLAALRPSLAAGWDRNWKAVAIGLFVFLGARASLDAWRQPTYGSWLGFGISYINPVPEAEFLASTNLGPRLYNLFDGGGYLLWRLYPQYKVMTDSRSFPYLAWFDDQYKFSMGDTFDDFLRRYPADVAVIELLHVPTWRNFLKSPDWRLVFYGPTAAVFVKRTVPYSGGLKAVGTKIRNAGTALRYFDFAAETGDFRTAWADLAWIETQLAYQAPANDLEAARAYRAAYQALHARDWALAKTLFDAAFKNKNPGDRDQLIRIFLNDIDSLRAQGKMDETLTFQAALTKLVAAEETR